MNYVKEYKMEEVWEILVAHAAREIPGNIEGTFKIKILENSVEVLFIEDKKKEEMN